MTSIAKIVRTRPTGILLAAEALTLLTFFRVCLALVRVRRIIELITRGRQETNAQHPMESEASLRTADRVCGAVEAVAHHAPIAFASFPQALAGYTMLRWRHVSSAIVFGMARSAEGKLIEHTWLIVGGRITLPGEGAGEFSPVERWT
jgi:hypothetical protein